MAQTPALQRFAWRRAGRNDLADDLVQETLMRAWMYRDKFEEGTNLAAWLHTILRNTHISHIRKVQREQVGLADGWEDLIATPASQDHHLDVLDVARAIAGLPVEQREVLVWAGIEGRAHEDIAREAGCALGTVRSRLSRARVRLHEILDGQAAETNLPLAA